MEGEGSFLLVSADQRDPAAYSGDGPILDDVNGLTNTLEVRGMKLTSETGKMTVAGNEWTQTAARMGMETSRCPNLV